jgi:Ser/Thr protein kinase RdoA (MazF antagonist)
VTPRDDTALAQACATLARRLGLGETAPEVIGRFSNRAVWLAPQPVVARVPTGTTAVRDANAFAARECALVQHLAQQGAPVIGPLDGERAGPHQEGGWTISLWQRARVLPAAPDPVESAGALAACHAALRAVPPPLQARFARWQPFDEVDRLLAHAAVQARLSTEDRALLAAQSAALRAQLEANTAPLQLIHGDAHLNNALHTAQGMRWHDWEDAFIGPIEWDLACVVSGARVLGSHAAWSEAVLAAYPAPWDAERLDLCIRARTLFTVAWMALLSGDDAEKLARLQGRLRWLHEQPAA